MNQPTLVEVRCMRSGGKKRPCRELLATLDIGPDGMRWVNVANPWHPGMKPALAAVFSAWGDNDDWVLSAPCPTHGRVRISVDDIRAAAKAARPGRPAVLKVYPPNDWRRRFRG